MNLNKALLIRAASSATVTILVLSGFLLFLVFKDGWGGNGPNNAVILVACLWIFGWPFAIAMAAAKRLGTRWGKESTTTRKAGGLMKAPRRGLHRAEGG